MNLVWSVLAMADRDAIFDHIQADNPAVAVAADERIGRQVARLAQFPRAGRVGRIDGTRELVINRTPFVAAYLVTPDAVRILRVLHGSQRWPDEMP